MKSAFIALALTLSLGLSAAQAREPLNPQTVLTQAQAAYAARGENPEALNASVGDIEEVLAGGVQDLAVKYSLGIIACRTYFYQGGKATTRAAKLAIYDKAMTACTNAKAVDGEAATNNAEAYFYYTCALGNWANANGVVASLARKPELISNLQATNARTAKDGTPGDKLDGYGTSRIMGRLYAKLPGFAGGDHNRAIAALKKAHTNAPQYSLNTVYYAEALLDGDDSEKDLAKSILEEMVARPLSFFDQKRLPETEEELANARDLLDTL